MISKSTSWEFESKEEQLGTEMCRTEFQPEGSVSEGKC